MIANVTVSAPSRLHFGLFSVGEAVERQFGGIGLMVESPRTIVSISEASELSIVGPESDDCLKFVRAWYENFHGLLSMNDLQSSDSGSFSQIPARIEIRSVPRRHCGLGSGTQLGMCIATALMSFFDLPALAAGELSASIGRGRRSAIGTYGFLQGGLLVDRGRTQSESIAPLDFRLDFPEGWPVMLITHRDSEGLFGNCESAAFDNLPDVSLAQRAAMADLVRDRIIPSVLQLDYPEFGRAVYQFGHQSGLYFESIQGGPYNGAEVTELIEFIREQGIDAVGQTSWGPCVFAILRHDELARELILNLKRRFGNAFEIVLTKADNVGARIINKADHANPI